MVFGPPLGAFRLTWWQPAAIFAAYAIGAVAAHEVGHQLLSGAPNWRFGFREGTVWSYAAGQDDHRFLDPITGLIIGAGAVAAWQRVRKGEREGET